MTPLFRCLMLAGLVQAAAGLAEPPAVTESWSGFRGPDVAGISGETWALNERGGIGLAVTWKSEIGSAYSGIAVAGGKAITMYADGESDVMAAFDVDNGRRVWSYVIAETYAGHDGSHDGPISTPLVAGGRVFGLGPRGQLFALELGSGEQIWSTDLVGEHGIEEPAWGFGASPILEAFVDEVVPFVDGRYRTIAAAAGRANIAQAWSGFPALLISLDRRDLFGKIGLQSLFLFTRMENVLDPLLEDIGEDPPEIYMDWGTYDLRSPHESWGMVAANREMVEKLRGKGIEIAGGEVHDGTGWSSWRQRTNRMFEALFPVSH